MVDKFKIGDLEIGKGFLVIGGPCAIESEEQLLETARAIKNNIQILRGGAYKPRTKPGSFEGLELEGLKILKKISSELNIPTITEVLDTRDVKVVAGYADILQIGARNMQNYELLKEVGKTGKPVLLKRGLASTIDEWLSAAQYILNEGNEKVILCERGIRTFETETRFTLDLAGALVAKQKSGLPVIVDPSHGTGRKELIAPLVLGIKAMGLDGVMVEAHWKPEQARCDKDQALTPEEFNSIFD